MEIVKELVNVKWLVLKVYTIKQSKIIKKIVFNFLKNTAWNQLQTISKSGLILTSLTPRNLK
jgi:hypothetical protein